MLQWFVIGKLWLANHVWPIQWLYMVLRKKWNTPGASARVPARLLGKTLASISECVDVDDWEKFSHQNLSSLFSPFWIKVILNENFVWTDYVRRGLFACVTVFIQKGLFYNHTQTSLAVVRELHCWNTQRTWPWWWLTWLAPLLCTQSTTWSKHSVSIVTIH